MAATSNCTTAPNPLTKLFEERLASFSYAFERMEDQPANISQAESNHLADAYLYAEELAIRTPAGNLSDLRAKAEMLWGDPNNIPDRSEIEPFLADLVRLTCREPSRVFDAERWLKRFEHAGGMWAVREDEVMILEPVNRDLSDLVDMLRAMDGVAAVKEVIRRRHATVLDDHLAPSSGELV